MWGNLFPLYVASHETINVTIKFLELPSQNIH